MTDSPQELALERLLELAGNADDGSVVTARARLLALQWPSLAAALAELLAAHDMRVPRPFRRAAAAVAEEASVPELPALPQSWCHCVRRPYRHLHDGTMPGNPVIEE